MKKGVVGTRELNMGMPQISELNYLTSPNLKLSMLIKLFYLREKKPVDGLSGTEI